MNDMTEAQFLVAIKNLHFKKNNNGEYALPKAAAEVIFQGVGVQEAADKYTCTQAQVSNTLKRIRHSLDCIEVPGE